MYSVNKKKWRENKASSTGVCCKIFYHGVDGRRNGVGMIVMEKYKYIRSEESI